MAVSQKTFYGSGSIYEMVFDEDTMTFPTTKAAMKTFIETYAIAGNQIGYLKNGFQLEVSTETLDDQSDLGEMRITLITKETGNINFQLFNANAGVLSVLYPTATTAQDGSTVVGGLKGTTQATHCIMFVAADKTGGQTCLVALGKNTSGFTLNWNPDSVEPMQFTYNILPYNTNGNLFITADIDFDDTTVYADLSALSISGVTLSPAFASDKTLYSGTATTATSTITATGKAGVSSTIKVNGSSYSSSASWSEGDNVVTVTTSGTDMTGRTYRVVVSYSA